MASRARCKIKSLFLDILDLSRSDACSQHALVRCGTPFIHRTNDHNNISYHAAFWNQVSFFFSNSVPCIVHFRAASAHDIKMQRGTVCYLHVGRGNGTHVEDLFLPWSICLHSNAFSLYVPEAQSSCKVVLTPAPRNTGIGGN